MIDKKVLYSIFIIILFLPNLFLFSQDNSLKGRIVQKIVIVGNEKTKDRVILREMKTKAGEPYQPDLLDKDMKRIESLRLFSRVRADAVKADDDAVILITVNERWYIFPIPILYRNEKSWKKWSYGLGVLHNNVRGLANELLAAGWLGFNPGFDVEYTNPWFGGDLKLNSHIEIYHMKFRSQNLKHDRFDETYRGIDWSIGKRWGYHIYTYAMFGYDFLTFPHQYQYLLPAEKDGQHIPSWGFGFTLDTRDLDQYPRSGSYISLYASQTKWKNQLDYLKYGGEARYYQRLIGDASLALRMAAMFSDGPLPFFAQTYLGYSERIRGQYYEQRQGGNRALASAELRIPVIPVRYMDIEEDSELFGHYSQDVPFGLDATLFYDIGNVWQQSESLSDGHTLEGFGAGLNVRVPYIDVFRIEYAFNPNSVGQVLFDIGVSF